MKLETLSHRIDACIFKNYTSDMARLRYDGPIPILLVDCLTNYNSMLQMGLVDGHDYITTSYRAVTTTEFTPFVGSRSGSKYAVLPYDPYWSRNCSESVPSLQGITPRRVSGRLIRASLKAVQVLDRYYQNGPHSRRIKVGVKHSHDTTDGTSFAWVYFTPESNFLRWDPHTNKYSPLDGLKIEPFLRDTVGNLFRAPPDLPTKQERN